MASLNVGTEVPNYTSLEKILMWSLLTYRDISKGQGAFFIEENGLGGSTSKAYPRCSGSPLPDSMGNWHWSGSVLIPIENNWDTNGKIVWNSAIEVITIDPLGQMQIPASYKKAALTP